MSGYLILATDRRRLGAEIRALSVPLKRAPKHPDSPALVAVKRGQVRAEIEWRRVTSNPKRIGAFPTRRLAVETLKRLSAQTRWAFTVFSDH
jgi:hypothetical protein